MVSPLPLLSAEILREHFSYDKDTGIVTRLKRTSNNSRVGDVVGSKRADGYLCTNLLGKNIFLHRLAWKLVTGEDPEWFIDHMNGVKSDNRWCNLRDVDSSTNIYNRMSKGYTQLPNGRYRATVTVKGKTYDVGYFNCPTAARIAHLQEKKRLGVLHVF